VDGDVDVRVSPAKCGDEAATDLLGGVCEGADGDRWSAGRSGHDPVNAAFATHGIGWHYETGVQLLRLILSGLFDRFPDLQIIAGHWGEVVLFYLDRIDQLRTSAKLAGAPSDYVRTNVFVTPSGIFSHRYLRWAIEIVGVERISFATDYPFAFAANGGARRFLEQADLTQTDRESIASGNWDRLRAAIRR
jgi:uncharacterized protein